MSAVPLALLLGSAGGAKADMPEYALKAQFLVELLSYAQWPAEAEPSGATFDLVVLGKSPFGSYLDDYVRNRTIQRRSIRVRYLAKAGDLDSCSAVFLCRSETSRAEPVCTWARNHHALTISDDEALARQGVMVNLLMEGHFVRLAVNPGAASSAGLSFSSRLLRNARILPSIRPTP